MKRTMRVGWLSSCVAVALAASACVGPEPTSHSESPSSSTSTTSAPSPAPIAAATDCPDLAVRTVDALQAYVDGFTGVRPEQLAAAAAEEQATLDHVATVMRERAQALSCDRLRAQLADELERLDGDTPLSSSVAETIRSSLLGTDDPSDPGRVDVTVNDADELLTAASQVGTGSVITLAAGTYELEQTLVLFRPVTLQGAADGRTVITSSAEGAALLSVADGTLELRDLTVRHIGAAPASVVVVQTGSHSLDGVELAGARRGDDGSGGFGLAVQPAVAAERSGSEVRDSTFRDNEAGGMLFGAEVAPTVSGVVVEGPGACGICFHQGAAGLVEGADIEGQDVGIHIEGEAAPTIRDSDIHDNTVGVAAVGSGAFELADNLIRRNAAGVEIAGSGSPTLDRDRLVDNTDVGLRLGQRAAATVTGVSVEGDSDVALVITDDADPTIEGSSLATSGEAGIVITGSARGTIAAATVTGPRIGMQIEQEAGPTIAGLDLEQVGEVSVILTGQSTPRLTDVTCVAGDTGIVVLLEGTRPDLGAGIRCEVVDQRE